MSMGKGKQTTRHSSIASRDGAKAKEGTKMAEPGEKAQKENVTETHEAGGSLDDKLEATAAKKNLSVTNVKSILHHLVKDQRVLKLVQRLAALEEEGGTRSRRQMADDWDELTAYEPRLTRSRVRQAVMSAVAAGSLSTHNTALLKKSIPTKAASKGSPSSEISDDLESSDEEYNPVISSGDEEEEEEDDQELEEESNEVENDEDGHGGTVTDECGTQYSGNVCVADSLSPSLAVTDTPTMKSSDSSLPATCTLTTVSSTALSSTSSSLPLSNAMATLSIPTEPSLSTSTQNRSPPTATPFSLTSTGDIPTSTSLAPTLPTVTLSASDREIQEAASFLASLAESHTLSPLHLLPQQQQSPVAHTDTAVNPVSSAGTTSSAAGISGIYRVVQSNPYHQEVSAVDRAREGPTSTEEEIAQRTRSKHPLHDVSITSLEAGLGLVEGEDPPTPRELDPDELWWHEWLNSLTTDTTNDSQPSHVAEEEEEEDGEYNFLADSLREEEKEEFRNDRAVRKEVDDLITELLNPSVEGSGGLLLSSDGPDLTGAYLLETLGVQIPTLSQQDTIETLMTSAPQSSSSSAVADGSTSVVPISTSPAGCYLTKEQSVQLWTQIQQHFQLIMQTFVLARFEPSLVFVSQVAAQALDELSRWCYSNEGSGGESLWHIPDLQDGLDLVKKLDPYNDHAVKISPSAGTPPKVPDGAQLVFMDTRLFWNYPQFLPASGFTPLTTNSTSMTKYFTPEEECLLVLGMEHYGPNSWEDIQQNILPTKTVKQLKFRVKNRCSKRSGSNVIKEYKRTKKIPQIREDTQPELPQWILAQEKKLTTQEKEEDQKKQKQIEQVKKILTTASRAAASRTTEHTPYVKRDTTTIQSASKSTTDLVISAPSVAGTSSRVSLGSKRNFTNGVSCVSKRPRVMGNARGRQGRGRNTLRLQYSGSAGDAEGRGSSRANLEHLLAVAEVSDPVARFSVSFLQEIKTAVSDSNPGVYQQFIRLLQQHCHHDWRPEQLYKEVSLLFESWPHLVTLFTEFLSPQDCLEANLLQEKHDVQNVKSFISKLQAQYSTAPLHLKAIIDKLKQLDTPSVTRQQVCDCVLPLIEVHQHLADELRRFVFHLAPAPRDDDVYEEVALDGLEEKPDNDGFEQVTLLP